MKSLLNPGVIVAALLVAVCVGQDAAGKNHRRRVALDRLAAAPSPLPPNTARPLSTLDSLLHQTSSRSGPLSMVMIKNGKTMYNRGFRGATNRTRFAITSCSKWLIASTVMTLVDDGRLRLDDPIYRYLPSFADGRKRQITLRHLLAHTSGLPGHVKRGQPREPDLAQSVNQLGRHTALSSTPGKRFCYGNLSYQVAVRVAEVVTRTPWHALFKARIAGPLGMADTNFPVSGLGKGINSAKSTVTDYAQFLQMFKNNGVSPGGTRVLSAEAVAEMIKSQTTGTEMGCVNRNEHQRVDRVEYGLGLWRERVDPVTKTPMSISHFGTAGFRGVINYQQDYVMVLGIKGNTYQQKHFLTRRFWETLHLIDNLDFSE